MTILPQFGGNQIITHCLILSFTVVKIWTVTQEASEESEKEDEKDSKKGAKKQKAKKTEKAKETKTKSKKARSEDEAEEGEDKEDEDDDDEEGSGDENEGFENEEGGDEYILVLHSVNNKRASHMMGDKSVSNFTFCHDPLGVMGWMCK